MTLNRLVLVGALLAVVCLVGCGSVGYQTASGGPGGTTGQAGTGSLPAHGSAQPAAQTPGAISGVAIGPHSILVGDMNLNGIADVADVLMLRRIAVGLEEVPPNRYPDLTGDGTVGEDDLRLLERAVVGLEPWPIRSIGSAIVLDIAPEVDGIRDGYSPRPVEVPEGRFTVDVRALEVADFDGFALRFDLGDRPGIRVDDVREGPFMGSEGAEVEFEPAVDGDGATVVCTVRNVSGGRLPSGEGVIAHIDFRALQPGSETTVAVTAVGQGLEEMPRQQALITHGALVLVASQ